MNCSWIVTPLAPLTTRIPLMDDIVRPQHRHVPRRVEPLPVAPQSVGLLPVGRVVAYQQLVVRHPQRREPGDGQQYACGGHEVPHGDENGSHQLLEELEDAAAVGGALGTGLGEDEAA